MTYAPILLFVYNRPEHTRQVVSSLLRNKEAADSPLFIYADQSQKPESDAAVQEVRRYIHSISGFKTITIIERETNWGLARTDKSRGVIRYYAKVKEKQAEIAINRVIDYVDHPEKYKEFLEMRADIMLMKS